MVYSCPETVSDMYVNLCEWLPRGRGGGVGGGAKWRGVEGRDRVQREEFAKMPSYGSLSRQLK